MQTRECNYCGAIVDLSVHQCTNCGGQVMPVVTTISKKRKLIFFWVLFLVLLITPFVYKRHVNDTATAIIAQLQSEAVHDASTNIKENIFYKKAQFSQVFAVISPIRLVVIEFYMTEGRFPVSLQELGFDAKSFDAGELIETIRLSNKGEIRINLDSKTFGEGKYLIYTPKGIMGGMNIQWSCSSNMKRNLIPFQCESIT